MIFKKKVTVRDVNRYLSPVVEKLLVKHKKISNPDFEAELEKVTGIKWKQVKNYKNHPSPNSVVASNAKVRDFVLRRYQGDIKRRVFEMSLYLITIVFMLSVLYHYYSNSRKTINYWVVNKNDNTINAFSVDHELRLDSINSVFRLGKLSDSNIKDIESFRCNDLPLSLYKSCSKSYAQNGGTLISLVLREDMITRISISTQDKNVTKDIESFQSEIILKRFIRNERLYTYKKERFEVINDDSQNLIISYYLGQ